MEAVAEAAVVVAEPGGGDVKWAFWLSTVFMLPPALGLSWLTPRWAALGGGGAVGKKDDGGEDGGAQPGGSAAYVRTVLGLGLLIFGIYVGAEIGFGGYVFAYLAGLRVDWPCACSLGPNLRFFLR